MNDFLQGIFLAIAKKMGLELVEKLPPVDDYFTTDDISITAVLANRISTITLMDSGIMVKGDNKRAEFIDNFVQEYVKGRMRVAAEIALGTGDCLIKPNTDGKRIAVDIITNQNFRITENVGDFIYGCLIKCDEVKIKSSIYERVEYHRLRNIEADGGTKSVCYIYQMAYKDGKEVPISSVPQWAGLKVETAIPNVDRLLFGRYKCPTVNRNDVNSINGVPVTYGLSKCIDYAKDSYERFNSEFEEKETMIFAPKQFFTKDSETGKPVIPKGKDRLFMKLRGSNVEDGFIQEYSPQIRDDSLTNGIEQNFKMLELLAGLSSGIITSPTTNFATATEMKANLQMSFAFITNFRNIIAKGTDDLVYSVNVICDANRITPTGTYELIPDWSYSYIESMESRFNQLMQAESLGWIDKAEGRAWTMSEDYEKAKEKVEEIEKESPKIMESLEV